MILLITFLQFILVFSVVVYLALNLIHLVRVEPVKGSLRSSPFISVCVPARNEARDIKACLTSLLHQDYPNFEVIAVDDHSTDATGEIIQSLAAEFPNLLHLKGQVLPSGWLGKPFALHQAVQKARGEYLIFTDADPVFQPWVLTSAVYHMTTNDLDMMTLMPGTEFVSFWERAVQPVVFGFIAALSRFKKINSPDSTSAMGFGAFIMVKKEVYESLGGHESIKDEVLEDVMLAKRAKRAGFKLLAADAKSIFSIRMYHSLKEIWTGWRKNIFIAMKKSVLRTLYYICVIFGFLVTPYLVLLGNILSGTGILLTGVALVALLLTLSASIHLCDEIRLNRRNAFLFPIGAFIMAAIMLNSMFQTLIKRQTEWRGRKYPA
ncbi:MAG: glycosyltransferase [Nitrospinae bacterium]|nr:glycosyltransferase [Nitrospinota bacterium]MDA1109026.1 glycosyltransferase [Nitrospinota bacterium]